MFVAADREANLASLGAARLDQMDDAARDLAWSNALAFNGYDEASFAELRRTQLTKDALAAPVRNSYLA